METKITKLFDEHKIKISDVSRKTGIAYGTLYDIARGKTAFERISIGQLIKIAEEFGMTVDELVGETDFDERRYRLCQIYDTLDDRGQRALLACAEGLLERF